MRYRYETLNLGDFYFDVSSSHILKSASKFDEYSDEIDASKIPVEWYSWMHFTPNRIEKTHDLEKYEWQKPHQSNKTGTQEAYYPNKDKKDVVYKKYKSWKSE